MVTSELMRMHDGGPASQGSADRAKSPTGGLAARHARTNLRVCATAHAIILRRRNFNSLLGGLVSHRRMCNNSHMATNLAIDDQLLEEARKIGGQKTKRATVTEALNEYIQRRKQQQIVELFGKVDFEPGYDYKKQRRRK